MTGQRFANLDAMRGVCALSVVLFHCSGLFVAQTIFCHGYLAVDLFFILSGFVIAHSYGGRLEAGYGLGRFLRARLRRLAPVYWIGTGLGIGMLIVVAAYRPAGTFYGPAAIATTGALSMLLIPQIAIAGPAFPANPAAWSLFGEAVANTVYGAWLHKARTGTLAMLAAASWSICAAYAYLNARGWCFGNEVIDLPFVPFKAIAGFLAGVVLYRLWRAGWLQRLPKVSPVIVLIVWTILSEVPSYGPTPTFDLLTVAVAGPVLIALLVQAPEIAPRPFLWLGDVSYPLYASHLSLVLIARESPVLGFSRGPDPIKASLLVLTCLAIAWAIHRFVERRNAVAQVFQSLKLTTPR